ncbi:uncharacterized protein EV420DRAFT_1736124 [Desarmillaria tabescens]|uniref:Uncharacterized protein n=1 Tax=Armillaria tabescens TaxID=1929756 RepID=A0AA39JB54_ARMTA|nr:uncharacterized protein EV420DRAFT_1736124 [Desarmillaria tabescens]KAK0438536.1 hypothetical protein EV420DRAFT_1736124 [Desarmillaria tabescens]
MGIITLLGLGTIWSYHATIIHTYFVVSLYHDSKISESSEISMRKIIDSEFASVEVATMQLSDSWFNAVIIKVLAHNAIYLPNYICQITDYNLGIYTALVTDLLWKIRA